MMTDKLTYILVYTLNMVYAAIAVYVLEVHGGVGITAAGQGVFDSMLQNQHSMLTMKLLGYGFALSTIAIVYVTFIEKQDKFYIALVVYAWLLVFYAFFLMQALLNGFLIVACLMSYAHFKRPSLQAGY